MNKGLNITVIPKILLFWYITIFISTEILSFLGLINRQLIISVNLIFIIIILFFYRQQITNLIRQLFVKKRFLYYAVILILILTFIQGFLSAPNTTDSMVRRLPIVMYWVQEHTLYQDTIRNGHDFMGPFSEYIFLHLYLIFNSDRMLFFSQWVAFAVTIILSFLITYHLLDSQEIAIYSSIFVATLPIAVLQATSVQMDMVTTVMVLFSLYFAFIFKEKPNLMNSFLLGFSIGLGILTKATYLTYLMFPVGVLTHLILGKWRNLLLLVIFMTIIVGVVNTRFIEQNLRLYGSVSGEKGKSVYRNELFTPQVTFSNMIKNLTIQFPFLVGSKMIEDGIIYIYNKIGIGVDDPRTNYFNVKFSVNPVIFPQEDRAGNPLHLILILSAGVMLVFSRSILKNRFVIGLYLLSIASFLLFSTIFKWQPFHSRLLMPFFIIGSISSIIILSRFKRFKIILDFILIASVILSFVLIVLNVSKPFISYNPFYRYIKNLTPPLSSIPESIFIKDREMQLFNARYYWYEPYREIMKKAKELQLNGTVVFKLMDEFEYPMWYFLKKNDLSLKVIPYSKKTDETVFIVTSEYPYYLKGYNTLCIKTKIDYGYACILVKDDKISRNKI